MTLVKFKRPTENALTSTNYFNSPFSGLMENFFGDNFFSKEFAAFVPAINISEQKENFNIELSAPGFEKNDFKIELEKGVLTISGKHNSESENTEKNYTRKEFNYGSFQRSFTLPENVKEDAIEAKYDNGILKIVVPKNEKEIAKPTKQISIS